METTIETPAIVRQAPTPDRTAGSAAQLTCQRWLAAADAGILALADELQDRPDIPVVAVVDPAGRCRGLVERMELFALVGRPFGREVLRRGRLSEIAHPVDCVDFRSTIFSLARRYASSQTPSQAPGGGAAAPGSSDAADANRNPWLALVEPDLVFHGLIHVDDVFRYLADLTQNDIALAARLQERLVTSAITVQPAACQVAAFADDAMGVGGDLPYSQRLPDGRVFAALCDVSGKGVAAAIVVTLMWGIFRTWDWRKGMERLIGVLNTIILDAFHRESYVTGVFMLYDPTRQRLLLADMGHAHIVMQRGRRLHTLRNSAANFPIGLDPELRPRLFSLPLRPSDTLFVYSDGIVEQTDASGQEYGERRLYHFLAKHAQADIHGLMAELRDDIRQYRSTVPQQDDQSCLALRLCDNPAGAPSAP